MAQDYDFFNAFVKLSRAVSSTLELEEILNIIVQESTKLTSAKGASVRLLKKKTEKLETIVSWGLSAEYLNKGILYRTNIPEIERGEYVIIENVPDSDLIEYPDEARKEGIKTIAGFPMIVKGTTIGSLRLFFSADRNFTGEETEFLQTAADHVALVIENARLYETVKRQYDRLMEETIWWFDYGKKS